MNVDEYVKDRLDIQIKWYDSKSIKNQKIFKRLRNAELLLSALIPLLVGHIEDVTQLSYVVGILGVSITVIAGVLSLHKYHENWIEYRSICETLRHEKYMFLAKAGVYSGENNLYQLLVERVESVISHENINWAQVNKSKSGGKNSG